MSTLSTRAKILGFLLLGTIFLVALEGIARVYFKGPRWLNQTYVEMSEGFPHLEELLDDTKKVPSSPKYYDEFLYGAGPVTTKHVNITDYYSARLTPASVPLSSAEYIVWAFGGSTMENTETTDDLSIANTWARIFNESLGPTHVKNFGSGGFFSSYELIKFQKMLREVPENEIASIAIFYDGYNDAFFGFQYGPGSLQKDLSLKLQALVEQNNLVLWSYTTSEMLAKYSRLWERSGARLVESLLFPFPEPRGDEADLAAAVNIYVHNVNMIKAICELYDIECFFILQPLIVTKVPLAPLEQEVLNRMESHPRLGAKGTRFIRDFYTQAAQLLAGQERFINASSILDGRNQPDFYDLGHTAVQTSPIIGERTARMILERLIGDLPPSH